MTLWRHRYGCIRSPRNPLCFLPFLLYFRILVHTYLENTDWFRVFLMDETVPSSIPSCVTKALALRNNYISTSWCTRNLARVWQRRMSGSHAFTKFVRRLKANGLSPFHPKWWSFATSHLSRPGLLSVERYTPRGMRLWRNISLNRVLSTSLFPHLQQRKSLQLTHNCLC